MYFMITCTFLLWQKDTYINKSAIAANSHTLAPTFCQFTYLVFVISLPILVRFLSILFNVVRNYVLAME